MSRTLSFAGLGLLAACLTLSAPSVSHAQHYRFGFGGYGRDCYDSYGYGAYGNFGYRSGYRGFGLGRFGGYGYSRPTIVHPEYLHWTPYRGLHTHGHLHVPHRGHYHTYPY